MATLCQSRQLLLNRRPGLSGASRSINWAQIPNSFGLQFLAKNLCHKIWWRLKEKRKTNGNRLVQRLIFCFPFGLTMEPTRKCQQLAEKLARVITICGTKVGEVLHLLLALDAFRRAKTSEAPANSNRKLERKKRAKGEWKAETAELCWLYLS